MEWKAVSLHELSKAQGETVLVTGDNEVVSGYVVGSGYSGMTVVTDMGAVYLSRKFLIEEDAQLHVRVETN